MQPCTDIHKSENIFAINIVIKKNDVINKYVLQDHENNELGIYYPENSFYKCTGLNLRSLIFESMTISNNTFINDMFNQIKYVNLEFNKIDKIIILPPKLEVLICGYNEIKRLENVPSTVKIIAASHNLIEHVDVKNCNIKHLDLSNNKLTNRSKLLIPDHIECLNLSYNELTYLNFKDKSILNLNVNYNLIDKIFELPDDLNKLSCIENKITNFKLPNKLNDKLIYLNLTKNNLKHLEGNFITLIDLLISNNKLKKIEAKFSQLQKLHFSYNNIKYFDIPPTVTSLCCIGTRMTEIKINDQMINVYLPFESLTKISPFKTFIKLCRQNHIHINNEDYIKKLAAIIIQRAFRKFNQKYTNRRKNISRQEDPKKNNMVIYI